MNTLSRREEDTLLKATKNHALKECDPVVKAFADCAKENTFTVSFRCRAQLKEVQECMLQFTGPEPMALVRTEYLRLRYEQQTSQVPQPGHTPAL